MAKISKLNVDEFLTEQGIEVIIQDKKYLIQDIPLEVQDILSTVPIDYKKVVKLFLGLPEDSTVLDRYGIVALAKIVTAVHENLLLGVSKETP